MMGQCYMVEFDLPQLFEKEIEAQQEKQAAKIQELMSIGKIKSYSMAGNRSKHYAIFIAKSEFEVLEIISQLPSSRFMIPSICELSFHQSMQSTISLVLN